MSMVFLIFYYYKWRIFLFVFLHSRLLPTLVWHSLSDLCFWNSFLIEWIDSNCTDLLKKFDVGCNCCSVWYHGFVLFLWRIFLFASLVSRTHLLLWIGWMVGKFLCSINVWVLTFLEDLIYLPYLYLPFTSMIPSCHHFAPPPSEWLLIKILSILINLL